MKRISFLLTLLLLINVSCAKNELVQIGTQKNGSFTLKVQAPVDTKVAIDGASVKWDAEDEIYIVPVGANKADTMYLMNIDPASISVDGKSAEFKGDFDPVAGSYIAVSGADVRKDGISGKIVVSRSTTDQIADNDGTHLENDWIMKSNVFEANSTDIPSIVFENMQSVLSLKLKMQDGASAQTVSKLIFKAEKSTFSEVVLIDDNGYTENSVINTDVVLNFPNNATISSTSECTALIPIIWNSDISDVTGDFSITLKNTDDETSEVTVPARELTSGKLYTASLVFAEPINAAKSDRDVLIELYNATDGANWANNENWCTDAPLAEWYGVSTDFENRVRTLLLTNNNLSGELPESIGKLSNLEQLYVDGDGVKGDIPESLCNLSNLRDLYIYCNNITGAIPESIDNLTELSVLRLYSWGLSGTIPESIGSLTNLEYLTISGSSYNADGGMGQISGEIPDVFGSMTKLKSLDFNCMHISGAVPRSIGELTNLESLDLSFNQLEGSIDFMSSLTNLQYVNIMANKFSGAVPAQLATLPNWNTIVWELQTQQAGYGFTDFPDVYLESSNLVTIDGKTINTEDFFNDNELTCVVLWRTWCGWSTRYLETLTELYNSYADKGFRLITLDDEEDLATIQNYILNNEIPGETCQLHGWGYDDGSNRVKYMPTTSSPTFAFVDKTGKIVFSESLQQFDDPSMSREEATKAFMLEYLGDPIVVDKYESTDYSKDGEVTTLQTATVGNGIDLVIMGDGFVDTDMNEGGEYETRMAEAMEHFFSEEPYKTFRNRYNVYAVKAVSKNEGIKTETDNETAFSAFFGDGTFIGGDDVKVFEYVLKVPSITRSEDVTVITVLNSSKYAGTCYMYTDGSSIGYCPIVSSDDEQFRQIVVHEVGGHGFAKLLDEYAYSGAITDEATQVFLAQKEMGWGANVDITSDASKIQWAHFLADSRYDGLVSIYEGALTFETGAYRPTDESIMRYNTGDYNAPSREAIYKRIMKLSGDTYDYEKFVKYDAINRSVSTQAANRAETRAVNKSTFIPLAHPVIKYGSPIK